MEKKYNVHKKMLQKMVLLSMCLVSSPYAIAGERVVLRPKEKKVSDVGVREWTINIEGEEFKKIVRINYVNDEEEAHYAINGKMVTASQYENRLRKAKMKRKKAKESFRSWREKEEKDRARELYLTGSLRRLDTRKQLITQAMDKINQAECLTPFHQFDNATIASSQELDGIKEKLREANVILGEKGKNYSLAQINTVLEGLPLDIEEKMKSFYFNSLQYALNTVHDDHLLQKITALVA